MDSVLESRSIPWSNCVGLSVDNTSVNMGRHNSIMTRATQKNPAVYMMGCPCHILHNTAQKANHSFQNVCHYYNNRQLFTCTYHFRQQGLMLMIFWLTCRCYYFDKSTKRRLSQQVHYCMMLYMSSFSVHRHFCLPKYSLSVSEFAEFCDLEYRKIIHHINVRWLSLQTAVDRTLLQYPLLKSYFVSKGKYPHILFVHA